MPCRYGSTGGRPGSLPRMVVSDQASNRMSEVGTIVGVGANAASRSPASCRLSPASSEWNKFRRASGDASSRCCPSESGQSHAGSRWRSSIVFQRACSYSGDFGFGSRSVSYTTSISEAPPPRRFTRPSRCDMLSSVVRSRPCDRRRDRRRLHRPTCRPGTRCLAAAAPGGREGNGQDFVFCRQPVAFQSPQRSGQYLDLIRRDPRFLVRQHFVYLRDVLDRTDEDQDRLSRWFPARPRTTASLHQHDLPRGTEFPFSP